MPGETLRAAAVCYHGEIFEGRIHLDAIAQLEFAHPGLHYCEYTQGFVTTSGQFLDMYEAKRMAEEQDLLRTTHSAITDPKLRCEYLMRGVLRP